MKAKRIVFTLIVLILGVIGASFTYTLAYELPVGFVLIKDIIPDIKEDLRYATKNNFIGERIDGYIKPIGILTKEAAEALKKVQDELKLFGLGLKIYDAYRPQQAVNHFVRWTKDLNDIKMKSQYYPDVAKKDLFKLGYIAAKSGHSRGSTVDLIIISFDPDGTIKELDMGTGFDLFSPKSCPNNLSMTPNQRAHRMLLQTLMKKHGFLPYSKEWWHFTLKNEPFPNTYFNFLTNNHP